MRGCRRGTNLSVSGLGVNYAHVLQHSLPPVAKGDYVCVWRGVRPASRGVSTRRARFARADGAQ
eukprot:4392188-Lingulodinium_polyedra.AAC.1